MGTLLWLVGLVWAYIVAVTFLLRYPQVRVGPLMPAWMLMIMPPMLAAMSSVLVLERLGSPAI